MTVGIRHPSVLDDFDIPNPRARRTFQGSADGGGDNKARGFMELKRLRKIQAERKRARGWFERAARVVLP